MRKIFLRQLVDGIEVIAHRTRLHNLLPRLASALFFHIFPKGAHLREELGFARDDGREVGVVMVVHFL